jgi:hypothetical protein
MKLKVVSLINNQITYSDQPEYNYEIKGYRIKFLGEVLELSTNNIPFIDIMQFWFERKASRNCYLWYHKHKNSFYWNLKAKFWSKLEWYWRKIYQYNRKKKDLF